MSHRPSAQGPTNPTSVDKTEQQACVVPHGEVVSWYLKKGPPVLLFPLVTNLCASLPQECQLSSFCPSSRGIVPSSAMNWVHYVLELSASWLSPHNCLCILFLYLLVTSYYKPCSSFFSPSCQASIPPLCPPLSRSPFPLPLLALKTWDIRQQRIVISERWDTSEMSPVNGQTRCLEKVFRP